MIITFFPRGCRAGRPDYLIGTRADRVMAYIGDPVAYSNLLCTLATENRFTTGVLSWETTVDPNLALKITQEFVREWLIVGADPVAIPSFIVIHDEPCLWHASGHRTAAHFSVANVHLGLLRAVRPYVHTRCDFWSLRAWQNLLNRTHGWRVPSEANARHRFSPQPVGAASSYVYSLLRAGMDRLSLELPEQFDQREFEEALFKAVRTFNSVPELWPNGLQADANGPAATIVPTIKSERNEPKYYIKLSSGDYFPFCKFRVSTRQISRRTRGKGRRGEIIAANFREISAARAESLPSRYRDRWSDRIDCSSGARDFVLRAKFSQERGDEHSADRDHGQVRVDLGSPESVERTVREVHLDCLEGATGDGGAARLPDHFGHR